MSKIDIIQCTYSYLFATRSLSIDTVGIVRFCGVHNYDVTKPLTHQLPAIAWKQVADAQTQNIELRWMQYIKKWLER